METQETQTPHNQYDNEAFREAVRLEIQRVAHEAVMKEFNESIVRIVKGAFGAIPKNSEA